MPRFHIGELMAGIVLVILLAGCGQKGPLYLPQSPGQSPAPEQAPPRP